MPTEAEMRARLHRRYDAQGRAVADTARAGFAAVGDRLHVPLMGFADAAGNGPQQPAQPAAPVYTYADACMGLYPVRAAPTALQSVSDADLAREVAYARHKREKGDFDLQTGEVGSLMPPAANMVELQARADVAAAFRNHRLENAWRNEDDAEGSK